MGKVEEPGWYGAKTLYSHDDFTRRDGKPTFEERVVVFKADGFSHATDLAEEEARAYAEGLDETRYLGFVSLFHAFEKELGSGFEVFSIMRRVEMDEDDFITHYYDDGTFNVRSDSSDTV